MTRTVRLTALTLALLGTTACLRRTLTVTSDPPGAIVWLNDEEIGRTPVETGFKYYGLYDVRLRKEGYQPLNTSKRVWTPWYEYPPLDLGANLVPGAESNFTWHFELEPRQPLTPETEAELMDRAVELRTLSTGEQRSGG